jgi:hypothetical protein
MNQNDNQSLSIIARKQGYRMVNFALSQKAAIGRQQRAASAKAFLSAGD